MAEELGKIEKPSAEEFDVGRKVFYVPLVFSPMDPETDLLALVNRYWDEVGDQVANLEAKLGNIAKVYHEMVPVGGEDGAKIIEELSTGSYKVSRKWLDGGAELQPIEEAEELAEFIDWSKCLFIGMQSVKVATKIFDFYREAHKLRSENITKRLDESLKEGEIGVLLMREGHQVQYPSDVKVFYIAPPSLDEIHRWMRARADKAQAGDTNGQDSG
jgi:hypothetical protein